MTSADGSQAPFNRNHAFVAMLIMVPLGGAATDIYIPSLPAMETHFEADRFAIQATLLIFMVGYGVGQILAGPITDALGRRMPIILSTALFVIASVGIALAPPLDWVLALRFAQGIFVACSAVGARAIVADCYEGDERKKAANWMTIAWAIGPILSPALGGYLQVWFGWTASFWVLAGWGVVVVVVAALLLPETRHAHHRQPLGASFAVYRTMVTDRVYLPTAIGMACLISVMYGFETLAPFYIQTDLNHSAIFYGHIQLVLGALWLSGNLFNRFAITRFQVITIIIVAGGVSFAVSGTMLFVDLSGHFSLLWLVVPVAIVYFFASMIWPNGYAQCLERFKHAGGSANALVSGLFVILSAGFAACASLLETTSAWPLWLLYVSVTAAALLCFVGLLRREFSHKVGRH